MPYAAPTAQTIHAIRLLRQTSDAHNCPEFFDLAILDDPRLGQVRDRLLSLLGRIPNANADAEAIRAAFYEVLAIEPGTDAERFQAFDFVCTELLEESDEALRRDALTLTPSALEAFWTAIAAQRPEITSGDFPPDAADELRVACVRAVTVWLETNRAV